MIKKNGRFAPTASEIKTAIKNARTYSRSTGNRVQLWFDIIDGKFHKEEFVGDDFYVVLNTEYEYGLSLTYDHIEMDAKCILEMIERG